MFGCVVLPVLFLLFLLDSGTCSATSLGGATLLFLCWGDMLVWCVLALARCLVLEVNYIIPGLFCPCSSCQLSHLLICSSRGSGWWGLVGCLICPLAAGCCRWVGFPSWSLFMYDALIFLGILSFLSLQMSLFWGGCLLVLGGWWVFLLTRMYSALCRK